MKGGVLLIEHYSDFLMGFLFHFEGYFYYIDSLR